MTVVFLLSYLTYKNHKDIFVFAIFSPGEIDGTGTQTLDFVMVRHVSYHCASENWTSMAA
jgi:hypothetical protein